MPRTAAVETLADLIEAEWNTNRAQERFSDVKTLLRSSMGPVNIRCLAIIAAGAIVNATETCKVTVKRSQPAVRNHASTRRLVAPQKR